MFVLVLRVTTRRSEPAGFRVDTLTRGRMKMLPLADRIVRLATYDDQDLRANLVKETEVIAQWLMQAKPGDTLQFSALGIEDADTVLVVSDREPTNQIVAVETVKEPSLQPAEAEKEMTPARTRKRG
jgi:hypothetical protein